MSYLEILAITPDGEPEETDHGFAYRYRWQTWLVFWLYKLFLSTHKGVCYLLDYRDGNGRLLGTVTLNEAGYRWLVGDTTGATQLEASRD